METVMKNATILVAGMLAAAALPVALQATPPAHAWQIGPLVRGRNYSVGMPSQPSNDREGGVNFEFPQAGGEIDAMTTRVGPLAGARQITMRYRVDAPSGARFIAVERPQEAAAVSLYFQRQGDNWSARGRYASYRWYVPDRAVFALSPGVHTLTVRLDEIWTNVKGVSNRQDPDGYHAALNETVAVGVAFGSSSFRSHGVYATGPARFTLLSFDIE
jgi:hypothetical protein